jgi:hypothetical protein
VAGPTGDVGPTGPQGDTGPTGPSATLTAGDYVVKGYVTGNQTIASGSDVVIQFVDDFDPKNWLDGYVFQPTQAGYYNISLSVHWNPGVDTSAQTNVQIRKNGSQQIAIYQEGVKTGVGYTLGVS